MKRHPSLEPFSRDHNVGLVLARRALDAAACAEGVRTETAAALVQCWKDELEDHFAEEERLLGPLVPTVEHRERLVREHRGFAQDVGRLTAGATDPELLEHAGQALHDHIRWEERVLFPEIEKAATQAQFQELSEETAAMEERRSNSTWSPKRGELMKKRERQESGHNL